MKYLLRLFPLMRPPPPPKLEQEGLLLDDEGEKNAFLLEEPTDDEGKQNSILPDDFSFDSEKSEKIKVKEEDNTFLLNKDKEENHTPTDEAEATKEEPLQQFLDTAKKWSEAGQSCVIITTRLPSIRHPGFLKTGMRHCQFSLDNLDEQEAIRYFDALMILPPMPAYGMPKRAAVEELFQKLSYHPLSIKMLAFQLKNDSISALNERLDSLLRELPADLAQSEKSLQASLNLLLEKLDPQMLSYLLKLGIFQDGAFENVLQGIINIPQALWQTLRQSLEASGLIQAENLEGVTVPYLKIHPAIAPRLWARLPSKEQQALKERYCQGYYEFSNFLYDEDNKNPYQARAIEQREMPNLLHALSGALDRETDWSLKFADKVKSFLVDFGLTSEQLMIALPDKRATSPTKSQEWFSAHSEQAEQLYSANRYQEAQAMFQEILEELGETASYDRCVALGWLGRCMAEQEQVDEGAEHFQQALEELQELEESPEVRQETGYMQSYLGAVLKEKEEYSGAKEAYEAALPVMKDIGDTENEVVIQDQLGTLEMLEGNLPKAERHHREALKRVEPLNKLILEAKSWHNLGTVYQKAKHWKAAAEAYQKAAKLFEEHDDLAGAAQNWELFAQASQKAGNMTDAENGYRKAIEGHKAAENFLSASIAYRNLAQRLYNQPESLDEARELAEAGLAIDKTLDPNVAEIWKTYILLANIAEKQHDAIQAQTYRRLAREAKANTAEGQNELRQHEQFVEAVVATVSRPELRGQLETMLRQREKKGWSKLATTIRRILDGERDCDSLCDSEGLDLTDSIIVQKIMQEIEKAPNLQEKGSQKPSRFSW
jgi:tetratricopeptide (TPR) repeat protein